MKKMLLIFSVVLAAILVSGTLFWIGSSASPEPIEPVSLSPAEQALQLAEFHQKQGHYEDAYSLLRQLLDTPVSAEMQRDISYRLGAAFLDDYRNNGAAVLDSAALYLQSVFNSDATDPELRLNVGRKLLYIAAEKEDSEHFFALADQLLAQELADADLFDLWQRKFDYLLDSNLPWSALQKMLLSAENLPVYGPEGVQLLKDNLLRANERILTDPVWFEQYAIAMESQPLPLKEKLFDEVSHLLAERMEAARGAVRGHYALRLGLAMAAVGNFEGAKLNLRLCLETAPCSDVVLALELIAKLFGETGDEVELQQLVTHLLHDQNFLEFERSQKMRMVDLLSYLKRYRDAMKVIALDLRLVEAGGGAETFLGDAVILEARQGRIEAAGKYMNELFALGVSEHFGHVLKEFVDLELAQNEYELVEEWGLRYLSGVPPQSDSAKEIYFALFEAAYWLKKPVPEKLYTGALAVHTNPDDERVAPVILRMADYIEKLGLYTLAGSYYNRIGLLNFLQEEKNVQQSDKNIGEQAMLGKARCLMHEGDWARADHLFRDLCRRTSSPLIRSEISVYWADLALRFGQPREATRRYELADPQLFSADQRAHYLLGQVRLRSSEMPRENDEVEAALATLSELNAEERAPAVVDFFDQMFDYFLEENNERGLDRLIDLAYQSDYADLIPIQSYVLRKLFRDVTLAKVGAISDSLQSMMLTERASMMDLAQVLRRTKTLSAEVGLHSKRSPDNE